MTSRSELRRRRGEERAIDLEDLDPREGLRRFAFAWFTRAAVLEGGEARAEADALSQPGRRRRGAKQDVGLSLRRRAFLWFRERPRPSTGALEGGEARALVEAPPQPGRRRRGAKQDVVLSLRRRAFLWFREHRATAGVLASPALAIAGSDVARGHLKGVLEALIFASEHPLPAKDLAGLARAELKVVKALLAELTAEYHDRGFRLDEIAGGYVFRTSPAFAPFVREQVAKKPVKMSRAQIETLAIVAYRQPITRPEIDDVRGVDSGAVLKSLLERDLVRILGKKEEPGRPILYGTTAEFLEFFGLKRLGDLPTLREFTELSDESRRAYEREMGEEPPEDGSPMGEPLSGLMGGEGALREADVAPLEQQEGATLQGEASRAQSGAKEEGKDRRETDHDMGQVEADGAEGEADSAEREADGAEGDADGAEREADGAEREADGAEREADGA